MTKINTQEMGMALIVLTICVSFFAVIVLAALGNPVPAELQSVVIAMFSAVAATATTWLVSTRLSEAKGAAERASLRAQNAELTTSMLRAGLDVPK